MEKSREARAMQLPLTSAEGVEKEERMWRMVSFAENFWQDLWASAKGER